MKPVWHKTNANVVGLEVIPLKDLGRPRIDVVPRISGFFRGQLPLLVQRIDEAVQMVAALDEPLESNLIRRHVLRDADAYMKEGMDRDIAMREATFRVFGCPPGTYGAGVSELVESKNWGDPGGPGQQLYPLLQPRLRQGQLRHPEAQGLPADALPYGRNREKRRFPEYDMMSCTDYYNYYGGLIAQARP